MARILIALLFFFWVTGAYAQTCPAAEIEIATTPIPPQTGNQMDAHHKLMEASFTGADVLALGDSHAAFWSLEAWSHVFPKLKLGIMGVPGDRASTTIWRMSQMNLTQVDPQAVILFIGANMVGGPLEPCAAVAGANLLLEKVHFAWPLAQIYVVKPFPRGWRFQTNADATRAYWDLLVATSKTEATFVDADAAINCGGEAAFAKAERLIMDFKFVGSPCEYFRDDLLHLTPKGYEQLANVLQHSGGVLSGR